MTDRELRVVQHLQNRFRELEEAQRVRDGRAVAADRGTHVPWRQLELRDQSLIAPRFIDRRQIVPLQVLDQGQREKRTVVSFALYGGNAFPAQLLAGAQAAPSRDQLECAISVRGFAHDDRGRAPPARLPATGLGTHSRDRKSTRLNSSYVESSY